jgi:hypothetical protein
MADKLRQIQKFAEILLHAMDDLPARADRALDVVDMGCGKGYLTFAAFETLRGAGWTPLRVPRRGRRPRRHCNRAAAAHGLDDCRSSAAASRTPRSTVSSTRCALAATRRRTTPSPAESMPRRADSRVACATRTAPRDPSPPPLAVALRTEPARASRRLVTDALRAGLSNGRYRTRSSISSATNTPRGM